ncbi:protein kinase [Streptomyces sp. NPDC050610]|uniref:serine/threonine protein kinase n=1 Tax=Streptomyces sp. NPDC050610 TaxID=3157097 RepID=UPI003446C809
MTEEGPRPFTVQVSRGYRVGRWEVREPLATGAFGSVYEARRVGPPETGDPEDLPERAALKFLPTGTRTPRQLRHLKDLAHRELTLHRKLRRPRLIRMYEAVTIDDPGDSALDGATVLVLERAEGSLDQLVERSAPGPVPGAPALLAQICEGLTQLHHAGWVHGDLKPANVLLMPDGSVRLGDFNLAAEMEGTHAYSPAFSTPDYTPPELLWSEVGERGQLIRPTADIWAFGTVAHLLLTGALPLPGAGRAARRDTLLRYARGDEELRLSPELPAAWREIIADCLARTHEERAEHSGTALLRRVEAAAGAEPAPRLPRLRPRRKPGRILSAVVAAAAVASIGYGITLIDTGPSSGGKDSKPVTPASYGASELRTDKGVPAEYRKLIVDSAHDCSESAVTPALIAALLKVESDFDPNLSDPAKDEYGIARWTPRVLRYYLPDAQRPKTGNPRPPFPPAVSIPAVGRYLCYISPQLWSTLPGDRRVLVAAAYLSSFSKVNNAGGVPPKQRPVTDRIAHYLKEYTPTARS